MKGIVLAGGTGSRLWPITKGISKQLLPIYDKPLIHYPIGTLMLAGIRELLIITTPEDKSSFQRLLGDGHQYGISLQYEVQPKPEGLAQSFIIGAEFIGDGGVALALGDNIFHGAGLGTHLKKFTNLSGAQIFAFKVKDASSYGVVEIGGEGNIVSIVEKPDNPKSNLAIPGLYFYDNQVVEIAEKLKPSSRNELEIGDINNDYLGRGSLFVHKLERGVSWFDTGTPENLHNAATYVRVIEERQGTKISCLEEIAWRNGWLSDSDITRSAEELFPSDYAKYLIGLLE